MSTSSSVPGLTTARLWAVLGALMLAVLLASMEITIIATALPTIAGEFDAFESFAWVGTAYIAAAAIGTPLLGKLSDLYGRRRVFLTTMGLFIVGSFLCGIAQSMGQLIAARAVQGLGGGAIQALAFAILGDILPRGSGAATSATSRSPSSAPPCSDRSSAGSSSTTGRGRGSSSSTSRWPASPPWSATTRCDCRSRVARPVSTSSARCCCR